MLQTTSPMLDIWINRASHRTMALLWSSGENIRSYFMLRETNEDLSRQNEALAGALRACLMREEKRNEELASREIPRSAFRYIPATIVKMSRNGTHNYVILNKGSDDGVTAQSGIICSSGIVGVVSAVSRHYSYGLTLMNPDMTVHVRIGRDGITTPLVWDGLSTDGAIIRDIPPHYDVSPGDTVWTSGFSAMFPADIPVGVTGNSELMYGSFKQVEIRLFQDFSSVRFVTITENIDLDEIEGLESEAIDKEGGR